MGGRSGVKPPLAFKAARCGSFPAAICFSTRAASTPSKHRITTLRFSAKTAPDTRIERTATTANLSFIDRDPNSGGRKIEYDNRVDDSLETLSTDLRNSLEPSIRVFFSREFVICSLHFERFTTEAAGRDLERLGLLRAFEKPTTAREALARAGHVPRAETPLEWMLSKLAEEGFLESFRESSPARYRLRDPHPPADSGAKEKALAIAPSSAPGFTIVDELSRNIVDYFEGRKTGEEILFSPARLSLWFDYFNNDNL